MSQPAITPQSAAEILPYVELTEVRTYSLVGRRDDSDRSEDITPDIGIRVTQEEIETRMRIAVNTGEAYLEADMSVVHLVQRPVNLWAHVVTEFIERVSVMAVYPFVREAVFTTASRLGVDAPVLGMVRGGQLGVGNLDGADFAPSQAPASVATLAEEFGVSTDEVRALLEGLGIAAPPRKKLGSEETARVRHVFHVGRARLASEEDG
ncbi:MAG: hypothetical protein HGA44_17285 [Cellulomonadaceae bacterium]|nr:hypothetical protein [Cellulomonadaceae bacterium]